MKSIWKDSVTLPKFYDIGGDWKTDILIIGGGLAGILCAYMLQQEGIDYMLIEADRICEGVTANTTAKITEQHGLIYNKMYNMFGNEITKLYLKANHEALSEYKKICQNIDCDFQIKDNYVYSIDNYSKLENEINTLVKIGWKAELVNEIPIPVITKGAVKFSNQAQFNPLKFVNVIVKKLNIFEHTKALEFMPGSVLTDKGIINAKQIVVATHFPINNKHGVYFIKEYQNRSYVIALENAQNVNGMYVDGAGDGLSFRNYNDYLLLGGGSHRTGRQGGKWDELREFARNNYPNSREKYFWATQDCMTLDVIPYIGRYGKHVRSLENLWVTTGFRKWGMTSSMVSAFIIRDALLGRQNEYAEVFDPHRSMLRKQLWINMGESASNFLNISKKRCPHLGCALKWNKEEHSWDCPCHGSRFSEEGEVLNNPATGDLRKK